MTPRHIVLTLPAASTDGLARLGRVARGSPFPVEPPGATEPQRPLIPLAQRAGSGGVSLQSLLPADSRRRVPFSSNPSCSCLQVPSP